MVELDMDDADELEIEEEAVVLENNVVELKIGPETETDTEVETGGELVMELEITNTVTSIHHT